MSELIKCPRCGASLPHDSPGEHCISCLLQLGLPADPLVEPLHPQPGTIQINPPTQTRPEKPGDRIGRYKLLQQIGEGGCGVVYMAEQAEPVRRRVALKVIKLGMDTKQVIARFEAERQALALMDHPNIAKVLDAGATDAGRPYFVMELVRGIKITDYCDQQKLSTRQRLGLFVQVCQAVQHAHQKGIIHRDLKPSNILVTEQDGNPVPKIIDFGIAKATTAAPLTDKTLFTAFDQFIGTPAYMSPEQAGLGGLDIDTRSDVYSLGVLLYELLTGKQPFDSAALRRSAIDEILRTIREQEPQRPSARLTVLTEQELTLVAQRHQIEPAKFSNLLRGDLDWIVMKTLEKDRARRYETASGLAADLHRHLVNEPIVARPPSNVYRFRKMVRRHKLIFAATATVALTACLGLIVSTVEAVRALKSEKSERAARQVADIQHKLAEKNASDATESAQSAGRLLYAADMRLASQAWAYGNLSRMVNLLDEHKARPGRLDPRGFEYFFLRELAKGDQEYTLHGHTNTVWAVAFSPDGKWLASRSESDTRLWDLGQRKQVAVWPSYKPNWAGAGQCAVSFSYNSQYLTIETEEGLQLCQVSTLQKRMLLTGKAARAAFSPVTNLIAFNINVPSEESKLPQIHIWDYLAEKEVMEVVSRSSGSGGEIWQWTPDGTRLLTDQGEWHVRWWDTGALACVATNRAVKQFLFGATVSRDGSLMATSDWSGEIWLLGLPGGNRLATFNSGSTAETAIDFLPSGKSLAAPGPNQDILIWNLETGQQAGELRGHRGKVHAIASSPVLDRVASGGEDCDVLVWNPSRRVSQAGISNQLLYANGNPPIFSPDGRLIALADNWNNSKILDSSNLTEVASITGLVASYSPDGRQLAFINQHNYGTNLELVIRQTGSSANRAAVYLEVPRNMDVLIAKISPDGSSIALTTRNNVNYDEGTLLCDAVSGKNIFYASSPLSSLGNGFLPDGSALVYIDSANSSQIRLFNLHSRQKTLYFECHESVTGFAISPDGKILAASRQDYSILLLDVTSGAEFGTLSGHTSKVWALAFSLDGRVLASGGMDSTIRLWNMATMREVLSFPTDRAVSWLAFSPDNQLLVSGGIGAYHVWHAPRIDAAVTPTLSLMSPANFPTNSIWRIPDGTYGSKQ